MSYKEFKSFSLESLITHRRDRSALNDHYVNIGVPLDIKPSSTLYGVISKKSKAGKLVREKVKKSLGHG